MDKIDQHKASLSEVYHSVDTTKPQGLWRKLFAFLGPAYLISVGYMDPGNWATDIAGGSKYGYALIWVLLMSNLIALLLQSLSARLGIVAQDDLAQASKAKYPKWINLYLYFLAEIAITATDLAEVLGMAIGLKLLTGLPLWIGVSITVFDTFLLLILQKYGIRKMEAFILGLISVIGISFLVQMIFAKPDLGGIMTGFIPSIPDHSALYIAIGIIGATVMPHNLYLHSSLVQSRKIDRSTAGIKNALRFNFIDSAIALNLAFLVNAAILILAASTFYSNGYFGIADIEDAYKMLEPLLGNKWAPILFAVALIAAGQCSTITGTLAGQIVMEGYLNLRIQPWLRRTLTRVLAVGPALLVIILWGEEKTGELLVLSQVVLSIQLGFAIVPLIHFVSDKEKMGEYAIKPLMKSLAWLCAAIIIALNIKLVWGSVGDFYNSNPDNWWAKAAIAIVCLFSFIILCYITLQPFFIKNKARPSSFLHGNLHPLQLQAQAGFKKIGVCVDFSNTDQLALNHALAQGGMQAQYYLIHVVETAGAWLLGQETADKETHQDLSFLKNYTSQLQAKGYHVDYFLGYGSPKKAIPAIINQNNFDLLIMGAHGHTLVKDIIFGTTVDTVRHRVQVPVLVVRSK